MSRFLHGLLVLLLIAPAFAQEQGGVIVVEAENFTSNTAREAHSWQAASSVSGFSGTGYMEAQPNNGTGITTDITTTSPELQFTVSFASTGTRYVWVRGHGATTSDDSVHFGLNGSVASALTLTAINQWQWTNTLQAGGAGSVAVTGTGTQTFNLWMREDGMRVDRVLLTTNANFQPRIGNAWHIPRNPEPGIGSMRLPFVVTPTTSVTIYSGNQFQGAGEAGNQVVSGSTVFYKKSTDSAWTAAPMAFHSESGNNKYFSATIPAGFAEGDRLQYYLRISYSDHLPTFIHGTDTSSSKTELESVARASPFSVVVQTPEFWQSQNIYQVITDRFYDGDPSNNNGSGTFNPTGSRTVHGGDFAGLEQKLDYIKALGATAVWISPIVVNTDGQFHGYGAMDFYNVAAHWGTLAELKSLVEAAHARGILMILDVVTNHGGRLLDSGDSGFPAFRAPPNGYTMRWRSAKRYAPPFDLNATNPTIESLFHNHGNIQDFNNTQQLELGALSGLDDLRTDLPYVRDKMAEIYNYWIEEAGFDGYRIDTVKHVELGFWQNWSPRIHQRAAELGKPNFFLFGEVLDGGDGKCGSYTGIKGGGAFALDSVIDYPMFFRVNSVFATATGNTTQIEDRYNGIAANYDPVAQMRLVLNLDNHDQSRFLSSSNANNNLNRMRVALTWMYTSRGIPCLYYGTEQGFNGSNDPFNREDMFAGGFEHGPSVGDNFNMTHPMFLHVAKLNNFRRLYPALTLGTHVNLWNNPNGPGLFAYARRLGGQEVFVVFNTAGSSQTLPARSTIYPSGTVLVNLLDPQEAITVSSNQTPSITVTPSSAKIFTAQSQAQELNPVVTNLSPAHDASNISTASTVTLTFSKPMNAQSVQAAFSTTPSTSGTFAWSEDAKTVTYTSGGAGLPGMTMMNVRVGQAAQDATGTAMHAPFESRFATAENSFVDTEPPVVSIESPEAGATVSGSLTISGTATDNVGVQRMEVQVDGSVWLVASGSTSWSAELNSRNFRNGTRTISARAFDAAGNISELDGISVRFFNEPGEYVQRVSAGSPVDVSDCEEQLWLSDRAYSLGGFGHSGGNAGDSTNTINGICAEGQQLYQRERSVSQTGVFRYLFDCPPGVYEVRLLNAETSKSGPNERVFDVLIEGERVLQSFDIFVTAGGANIPISHMFTTAVTDAQIDVEFFPIFDSARISGVEVRKVAEVFSDTDGIPDWWRLAHFDHPTGQESDGSRGSDDSDGDGQDNYREYVAGTDPLDVESLFRIISAEPVAGESGQVRIIWSSVAKRVYQVRAADSISGQWNAISGEITASDATSEFLDTAAGNSSRFYRVVLVE